MLAIDAEAPIEKPMPQWCKNHLKWKQNPPILEHWSDTEIDTSAVRSCSRKKAPPPTPPGAQHQPSGCPVTAIGVPGSKVNWNLFVLVRVCGLLGFGSLVYRNSEEEGSSISGSSNKLVPNNEGFIFLPVTLPGASRSFWFPNFAKAPMGRKWLPEFRTRIRGRINADRVRKKDIGNDITNPQLGPLETQTQIQGSFWVPPGFLLASFQ